MRAVLPLLLLGVATGVAADDLGRLFFTPDERARLDAERTASIEAPAAASVMPPPPAVVDALPETPPAPVTLNGIVLRGDGPSTAWVNGLPATRRELAAREDRQLRITRDGVEVVDEAARAQVRPGQTFDPVQGRVSEAFEATAPDAPR